MNKLVKRTLAFLLVTCMLFGTMVMPTFAAETDVETTEAVTYTYDFTVLSNKDNTHVNTTAADRTANVFWGHSTNMFYGFGNTNHLNISASANRTVTDFYNNGSAAFTYGEGEDAVEYSTDLDLNWMVLGGKTMPTKKYSFTFPDDVTGTADLVPDYCVQGGYYYDNYKVSGDAAATKKFDYNGLSYFHRVLNEESYNKKGDGSFNTFAYTDIPGGWIAIKIKAPKVGTYAVQMGYTTRNNGAQQASVYLLPGVVSDSETIEAAIKAGTGKLDGTVNFYKNSGSYEPAATPADLGTYTVSEPVDEYTVIITTDLSCTNSAETGTARTFIDSLTFTQQAESTVVLGKDKTYDLRLYNTYGSTEFPDQCDLTSTDVQAKIDAKYGETGWTFLGSTFTGNQQSRNNFLYFNSAGSATNPGYIAIKMKSPGAGTYQLDSRMYCMTYTGYNSGGNVYTYTTPMWMDAYIVKLTDGMSEDSYADYLDDATLVGSYEPAYSNNVKQNSYMDDTLGTYAFEKDAEYILYLRRTTDSTIDTNANNQTSDDVEYYTANNCYPCYITATALPATVATIGENYTAPDPETYYMNRDENNKYLSNLYVGLKNQYTDGTADGTNGGWLIQTGSAINGSTTFTADDATWTINGNAQYLRGKNATGKAYYFRYDDEYNFTVPSPTATLIDNVALANAMEADYDARNLNWTVLGASYASTISFQSTGAQFNDIKATSATDARYAALKLRAPGTGNYTMDLDLYTAVSTTDVDTYNYAHQGLNVYIVEIDGTTVTEENWESVKPETPNAYFNAQYNNSTEGGRDVVALVKYGTENTPFTFDFVADKDYIVYLEGRWEGTDYTKGKDDDGNGVDGDYSAGHIYLNGITLASSIPGTTMQEYTTLTEALANAKSGETIKLQSNVVLSEVVIPVGVTLDLNGYTLSTAAVAPTGKLVGEGVVKTYVDTFTSADLFADNTLPLYDAEAQGYKFYEYTLGKGVAIADEAADAVKFWYQFQFTGDNAADAYALVASGTSGLTMGVNVYTTANGDPTFCSFENKKDADIKNDPAAWAAAYASFAAKATDPWLWVNVTSASLAESLSVAPVIRAGGADIVGAPIK